MRRSGGTLMNIATPIKAWAQRFAFLLLVGAAFALMLAGRTDSVIIERARSLVTDAITPVLEALSQPVATVANILREGQELAALKAQNTALRRENERLHQWQEAARRLEAENAALSQLLNMAPEPTTEYVTGRVIADTGGAFVRSVLINAGSNHGVEKGQAALTGEGLAGRVAEVGSKSARILLITDINSRIPVVVQDTRQRAILAGDNSELPKLLYLSDQSRLSEGQRIVTSGHGGVFPPGLPVGRIARVNDQAARVSPFAEWTSMEYLRIVDYGMPANLLTEVTETAPKPPESASVDDGAEPQ